jgi:hypothetical protein
MLNIDGTGSGCYNWHPELNHPFIKQKSHKASFADRFLD